MRKKLIKKNVNNVNLRNFGKQINNLTNKTKDNYLKKYDSAEILTLRDRALKERNISVLEFTTNELNKRKGLKGSQLREQNKKDLRYLEVTTRQERIYAYWNKQAKKVAEKIAKYEKKINISPSKTQLNTTNFLPSSEMIRLGIDKYLERVLMFNRIAPIKPKDKSKIRKGMLYRRDEKELIEESKNRFIEAIKKGKELNISLINKASLNEAINFMDRINPNDKGGYFKHGDIVKQAIINEYLKYLSVQDRLRIEALLLSQEFKKQYDSDEENQTYDSNLDSEDRAKKRQDKLIEILRNETGLIITADTRLNTSVTEIKNHQKQYDLTFEYFNV